MKTTYCTLIMGIWKVTNRRKKIHDQEENGTVGIVMEMLYGDKLLTFNIKNTVIDIFHVCYCFSLYKHAYWTISCFNIFIGVHFNLPFFFYIFYQRIGIVRSCREIWYFEGGTRGGKTKKVSGYKKKQRNKKNSLQLNYF